MKWEMASLEDGYRQLRIETHWDFFLSKQASTCLIISRAWTEGPLAS